MNCPACRDEQLVMSERQGIEIDYCPRCRGVWLDRGELDKIIERSAEHVAPVQQQPRQQHPQHQPTPHPKSMYDSDYGKYQYRKKKGPAYWLKELFD